jgi:hypothetical protein
LDSTPAGIQFTPVVNAVPVGPPGMMPVAQAQAVPMAQPVGAPPQADEMER